MPFKEDGEAEEVQATVDAIERAITDERSIKDKGKPVSLVDPG